MSRSLKVRSDSTKQAKLALQHNGFGSQIACAEELGLALSTLSRFLTGKTVIETLSKQLDRTKH